MLKVNKLFIGVILSFFMSTQSMAAFVLNGTRFIYEEGKNNISIDIINRSNSTYGGQVWIENTNQGDGVYMVTAPSFFKIDKNQKQIIRIMNVNDSLPKGQESLFWINVQEIPPKPKDADSNILAIAMNTQVKLIYRPKDLIKKRGNAESQIKVINSNGKTYLKNPTPFYFAIIDIKENGKSVKFSRNTIESIARFAPYSEVPLDKKLTGNVSLEVVDDWGGIQTYNIK
ncbi:fimbrial chaperone [Escherichia coli]|uniref:fimbrial chaperone n=1 Tax=Escherichia coli TaxID=562 RepID=UPI0035E8F8D1